MSRNPSGGIDVGIKSFSNDVGVTRVVTIRQPYLDMNDAQLLSGILVGSVIRVVYGAKEETLANLVKVIVVIDQVERINIEIITPFIYLKEQAARRNIKVVVCGAQNEVLRTIDRTPLRTVMTFTNTLEEAFDV